MSWRSQIRNTQELFSLLIKIWFPLTLFLQHLHSGIISLPLDKKELTNTLLFSNYLTKLQLCFFRWCRAVPVVAFWREDHYWVLCAHFLYVCQAWQIWLVINLHCWFQDSNFRYCGVKYVFHISILWHTIDHDFEFSSMYMRYVCFDSFNFHFGNIFTLSRLNHA